MNNRDRVVHQELSFTIGDQGLNQVDLVSIIIPCYNYGAYIGHTLASLQSQTHVHWEAIVVDDGSTDDTARIVSALSLEESRIVYIHQQNQGVSVARNTGMVLARGKFVIFLDADDLLSSTQLQAHLEVFRRCPSASISRSKLRFFPDGSPLELFTNYELDVRRESTREFSGDSQNTFPLLVRNNRLPLQTAMFRRELLQKAGFFEPGMKALEDWDYVLRCVLRGACIAEVKDPAAMAMVRVHSGSATQMVAFVDYLGRVYGNVQTEIDQLRAQGDQALASFYQGILNDTLADLDRRRVRRARKARRKEIMRQIVETGMVDIVGLYPVFRRYRANFFYAYLKVIIEKLQKVFR